MKKVILLLSFLSVVFLSACSNKELGESENNTTEENGAKEEVIIEKPGSNSMEEIVKDGNISNMENERRGKIKFHKFIIPSMNIAVYDTNPDNPEIIVEDEQFNSSNDVEIQYHEIETPLPDLIKGKDGFIKMIGKDISSDFEQVVKDQDRKTILDIVRIDANLDLGDINDIKLEKSDNKDLVSINNLSNIDSYELVSSTSKYLFYIYFDKEKSDRYYLVGIADGCAPTPCGNIVSIEFLE